MSKIKPSAWGRHVRQVREEMNLTQSELANRIGCDYTSIQNWESGRVQRASGANKRNLNVYLSRARRKDLHFK